MKRAMVVLTVLFVFNTAAFAQMGARQGGGMMGGGRGWGMDSTWFYAVIIAVLVILILGILYMMKRKQ